MRLFVDRDRFEAIIAGTAEPEEGRAARTALDPVGSRDRLAALGTGISTGQIAGIELEPWRISLTSDVVMTSRFFKCSLNGTDLLSETNRFLSAASPLHLDCVFCTTFLRVRMTQILRRQTRCIAHTTLACTDHSLTTCVGAQTFRRDVVRFSPHLWPADGTNRSHQSFTRPSARDCFYEKFSEVCARCHRGAAGFARCDGAEPRAV